MKEGGYQSRLHVSVNLLAGVWPPSCATPRRRRRAYAPTSNAASHNNHEKISSWVTFLSYMGMGLRLAAAGAPLKVYFTNPKNLFTLIFKNL